MRTESSGHQWSVSEWVIAGLHAVVVIEFVVCLCFVWWTVPAGTEVLPAGDFRGWPVFGSGGAHHAEVAFLGMLVTVIALAVRRVIPFVLAAMLAALMMWVGLDTLRHDHQIGFGHAHTAAYVGAALVGVAALLNVGNAIVTGARRRAGPPRIH